MDFHERAPHFNGDGFEDSLVEVSWHYRERTGLGNEILLVQRV